jgi:hypothetical protein
MKLPQPKLPVVPYFTLRLSEKSTMVSKPVSSTTTTASSTFHQLFSAGLGRNGRIASWIVAFAGAVRLQKNSVVSLSTLDRPT